MDQYGDELLGSRGLRANSPIAGGWRGAFESWCGDWKERSLSHAFIRRNYQSTTLCDQCGQCGAIQPFKRTSPHLMPMIYTDFRLDAPWTTTLRDHQAYLAETPRDQQTPWVDVPGFDLSRVRWDSAHIILLGTGKDVAASFLVDLVARKKVY